MQDNNNYYNSEPSSADSNHPSANVPETSYDDANNSETVYQTQTGQESQQPLQAEPPKEAEFTAHASKANKKQARPKRKNHLEVDEPLILWKDRKRILGLPISFTRYEIDENRFISRAGLLSTTTHETLLYRIMDLKLQCSLWQKMFRVGTITLYTADKSHNRIDLVNVKQPEKLRRFISNLVEKERDRRRITGRELFGVAGNYSGFEDIENSDF